MFLGLEKMIASFLPPEKLEEFEALATSFVKGVQEINERCKDIQLRLSVMEGIVIEPSNDDD